MTTSSPSVRRVRTAPGRPAVPVVQRCFGWFARAGDALAICGPLALVRANRILLLVHAADGPSRLTVEEDGNVVLWYLPLAEEGRPASGNRLEHATSTGPGWEEW